MRAAFKLKAMAFLTAAFAFGVGASVEGTAQMPGAFLQVIHNAADPAAAVVDIYVNGQRAIDDFRFRYSSNILPVPAGVGLTVGVAPGNSSSANDIIWTKQLPALQAGTAYIAVANGVLDTTKFAQNGDAESAARAFDLYILSGARQQASSPSNVALQVFHGATDAPKVDVVVRNNGSKLVDGLSYGKFLPNYIEVPAATYTLDVTPAGNPSTVVASYSAPLSTAAGFASVVVASGFLNPAANQNGAAFGLFALIAPNQPLLQLPPATLQTSRVQIIHNSPDPQAEIVDVYVNGTKAIPSFGFRGATGFIELPAGVPLTIGLALGENTTANDIDFTQTITLEGGKDYVVSAVGVLNPDNFDDNPNGIETNFELLVLSDVARTTQNDQQIEVLVAHGVPDAPAVNVVARGVGTLVRDLPFKGVSDIYITAPNGDYIIDLVLSSDTTVVVKSYQLEGEEGGTAVVLASGFLDPVTNQVPEVEYSFAMLVAATDGETSFLDELVPQASVQVIHNSPDPLAREVDVYINGELAVNNFAFRTASPRDEIPVGTTLVIQVAPPNSQSASEALATFTETFNEPGNYVLVANGVLNPTAFAANPNGRSTAFDLQVEKLGGTLTADAANLALIHGSTDAPNVDVLARGVGTLVSDFTYGDVVGIASVNKQNYTLDVNAGGQTVVSYQADLTDASDDLLTVFASGFLAPAANGNGPAFGLFVVGRLGGAAVPLPIVTSVRENIGADGKPVVTNYPNPFTETTVVSYNLDTPENVVLHVTDNLGRTIQRIEHGFRPTGTHTLEMNASSWAPGTYFLTLNTGTKSFTRRFIVTK